jgi:hypothetical protein
MVKAKTSKKTGSNRRSGGIWLTALLVLFSLSAFAQEISVEATVSKNPVSPGEAFNLTVTVRNSQGELQIPRIEGLQYIGGQRFGQNEIIVNGRQIVDYTYSFMYRANQEGTVSIPPIPVRTTKGLMRTQPIKLVVKKNTNPSINANFMTIIEPSRKKVYLGEPVVLRYKVYQRYGSMNIESYDLPDLEGFWKEQVEDHKGQWESKVINGQRYQEATLKVEVVFPQETGKFTLDGFTMTAIVGSFWNQQRVNSTPSSSTLEVIPLPEGKPANFLGTFDNLQLKGELSRSQLKANEAADLTLTFSGRGNLGLLGEPDVQWPSDLEVFDPEVKDRITTTVNGVSGSRTYSYVLIPRSAGRYQLPALTFSYFNTNTNRYETLSYAPGALEVEKGEAGASIDYSFNSKSDVQVLNKDIRYIRTEPGKLRRKSGQFFASTVFYFAYGAPFALFALAILVFRKRRAAEADVAGMRRKNAGRNARKWLKQAASAQAKGEDFYPALSRGLEHYIMDKFSIGRSDVTQRKVRELLTKKAGPELAERFLQLLEKCEASRFAPKSEASTAADLKEAENVIQQIEAAL